MAEFVVVGDWGRVRLLDRIALLLVSLDAVVGWDEASSCGDETCDIIHLVQGQLVKLKGRDPL